jgi:hypothetical protein
VRKPVVEQLENRPEIVLTRGTPLVLGGAPNGKALSAAFLADFVADYERHGKGIFALMRKRYPVVYFNALVRLAQVLKVEIGSVGAFDRPATTRLWIGSSSALARRRGRCWSSSWSR